MPSLISTGELAEIASSFKDLRDTFLTSSIDYHQVIERLDRFMEDSVQVAEQIYTLPAMLVEDKSVQGSQIDIERIGKYYEKNFYALVYWQDLVESGLAVDDTYLLKPDKDYLVIDGVRYDITGIVKVPGLVSVHSFLKIMFRKNISPID